MGVEHVSVQAPGNVSPTTGTRVTLGLSQRQGAILKAVHFTWRLLGSASLVLESALSEDLKTLTTGVVSPYLDSRGLVAIAQFLQTRATAEGVPNAHSTVVVPLWDLLVWQDLSYIPGTSTTVQRMDLYFEKFSVTDLEKAAQLRQQKRQFEFRR